MFLATRPRTFYWNVANSTKFDNFTTPIFWALSPSHQHHHHNAAGGVENHSIYHVKVCFSLFPIRDSPIYSIFVVAFLWVSVCNRLSNPKSAPDWQKKKWNCSIFWGAKVRTAPKTVLCVSGVIFSIAFDLEMRQGVRLGMILWELQTAIFGE